MTNMRTTIEIDSKLMRLAMQAAKTRTKRATVETALLLLVRLKRQEGVRGLRGKVRFVTGHDEY
jgi:Arc/MetJ family transcription regulator